MNLKNEVKVVSKYSNRIVRIIGLTFILIIFINLTLEIVFGELKNFKELVVQNIIFYGIIILPVISIILTTNGFNLMSSLGFPRSKISKAIFIYLVRLSLIITTIVTVFTLILNSFFSKGDITNIFFGLDLSKGFSIYILIDFIILFTIIIFSCTIGLIIGSIFTSKGVVNGLSFIVLLVVITMFFLNEIREFIASGVHLTLILGILFIISIVFFLTSFYLLKKSELTQYTVDFKKDEINVTINIKKIITIIVIAIIFSMVLYNKYKVSQFKEIILSPHAITIRDDINAPLIKGTTRFEGEAFIDDSEVIFNIISMIKESKFVRIISMDEADKYTDANYYIGTITYNVSNRTNYLGIVEVYDNGTFIASKGGDTKYIKGKLPKWGVEYIEKVFKEYSETDY